MFQFTHPGKGATQSPTIGLLRLGVSIHAPWEGCDEQYPQLELFAIGVSIHAPWEGCDNKCTPFRLQAHCFNSRTLGRVRQVYYDFYRRQDYVSIHAPWEGCDSARMPRERSLPTFQFTHPGKGATMLLCNAIVLVLFQFTHPGKGATPPSQTSVTSSLSFNSRTLGRVRLDVLNYYLLPIFVSIHAPWEGCDSTRSIRAIFAIGFNSRTLGRVRPE